MSTILDRSESHERAPKRPSALNPTEMRDRVPALGLREYWYPALKASRVGRRKPVGVTIMGEIAISPYLSERNVSVRITSTRPSEPIMLTS